MPITDFDRALDDQPTILDYSRDKDLKRGFATLCQKYGFQIVEFSNLPQEEQFIVEIPMPDFHTAESWAEHFKSAEGRHIVEDGIAMSDINRVVVQVSGFKPDGRTPYIYLEIPVTRSFLTSVIENLELYGLGIEQ